MDRIDGILIGPMECGRGAPMGRNAYHAHGHELRTMARRFYVRRIALDSGGYDRGGAYWGLGAPLYGAFSDEAVERDEYGPLELVPVRVYLRAASRDAAKRAILADYPGARFFDGPPDAGEGA